MNSENKSQLENLRKSTVRDLLNSKKESEDEMLKILCNPKNSDIKANRNIVALKKKIARLETIINEKIYQQLRSGESDGKSKT